MESAYHYVLWAGPSTGPNGRGRGRYARKLLMFASDATLAADAPYVPAVVACGEPSAISLSALLAGVACRVLAPLSSLRCGRANARSCGPLSRFASIGELQS